MHRSFGDTRMWSLGILVLVCGLGRGEDVEYYNPANLAVRGSWTEMGNSLRVFPKTLELDVNDDGIFDLAFRHDLAPRRRSIPVDAMRMFEVAEERVDEMMDLTLGMRRLAINAANSGFNDEDALARIQSNVDNRLHTLERLAAAPYDDVGLLDGSRGLRVLASARPVRPILATPASQVGSYTVEITTPAERATVTAGTGQTGGLSSDEFLVINNVAVELYENMSSFQVIDRINDFTSQTGVRANSYQGSIRLYSEDFGASAEVSVISNRAASATSSGFGTTETTDVGVDAVVEIGGNAYTARGNVVTADFGPEKGITIAIEGDIRVPDPIVTDLGAVGTVRVIDQSPSFTIDRTSGETVSYAFPTLGTAALGLTANFSNQFPNLAAIRVTTPHQAIDALEIIDGAYEELSRHQDELTNFLTANAYPLAAAQLSGLNGAEFSVSEFGLLEPGIDVGRLDFSSDLAVLQSSQSLPMDKQYGFVGVRIPVAGGWSYGWIGVEIQSDSSWIVTDYAWNTNPNRSLMTGTAAQPVDRWPIPGDANVDGQIDFSDFLELSKHFSQPGSWAQGDFNEDSFVDFADFLLLSSNFGTQPVSATVPEPELSWGMTMLLIAVALSHVRRRCRRPSQLRPRL